MYEKHIMKLADLHHTRVVTPGETEAIDAATALMRAAEPLDPKAEREYCKHVAESGCEELGLKARASRDLLWTWFERERGAARAEVEAKYQAMLAPKDEKAEREHCDHAVLEKNPLSMTERLMRERAAARAEVEAKYAAVKK